MLVVNNVEHLLVRLIIGRRAIGYCRVNVHSL